jgi:hypothetical protein
MFKNVVVGESALMYVLLPIVSAREAPGRMATPVDGVTVLAPIDKRTYAISFPKLVASAMVGDPVVGNRTFELTCPATRDATADGAKDAIAIVDFLDSLICWCVGVYF